MKRGRNIWSERAEWSQKRIVGREESDQITEGESRRLRRKQELEGTKEKSRVESEEDFEKRRNRFDEGRRVEGIEK